jgi:transcriptional regulator with XRE-family HTH domain
MNGSTGSGSFDYPPGNAELPGDFSDRLAALKERADLTWEEMAEILGIDARQLFRWRRGSEPSGAAMLGLVQLALRVPGGLSVLLAEDWSAGCGYEN